MTARGIRLNNPGNIRHNATFHWQGEIGVDKDNFIIFDTASNGIRALGRDLRNKIRRGLTTIEAILTVYSPPTENDTDSYIHAVSISTGIGKDDELTADQTTLEKLVKAVIRHECGEQPYSDGIISESVSLALA